METTMPTVSKKLTTRFFNWLGLTNEPVIKLYHGYGHTSQLIIYGHVLKFSPLPRKKYRKSVLHNTWALLRLFMVKPFTNVAVEMKWFDETLTTTTDETGFFKFEWKDKPPLHDGWQEITAVATYNQQYVAQQKGTVYIPHQTQHGFISDIDDTFLISHSGNMRKRLFVLFTQNARSRQPFDGSVKHYQLLAEGNATADKPNPFFFVSSSEWNLYDYILEFTIVNKMPKGVFLLSELKKLSGLLKTGQNNHQTKFTRIVRILQTYPQQKFVLLGDSTQQDPYIYQSLVKHFPTQIYAVYIRDVQKENKQKAIDVLTNIEQAGVPCCFFHHSSEAILHSKKLGLITNVKALQELELKP